MKAMHRKNNFDFLRLLFASFVIISHSYSLSGTKGCDWLCQISNDQISFSFIGVKGFFTISGFLIFQSLERSSDLLNYYWKRFLRLFPGLVVVLLLTVILARFVYENSNVSYLANKGMWTYIPNNLSLYKMQATIDGVFTNNPYKAIINGSLWTLPYEFTMYILLSFLFFSRKHVFLTRALLLFTFGFLATGNILSRHSSETHEFILSSKLFLDLGAYFMGGSLLASIKIEKKKYLGLLAFISLLLVIISLLFSHFGLVSFFTLPVIIIFFGLKSTIIISGTGNKIGDLSYGIYIYGFPVQQTLVYYFKLHYLSLMLSSIIISFFLGYLSWHLIEKKALKLKKNTPGRAFLRRSGLQNPI
jgi:peptidoglycan/LPS O-acetylase OafA/YrhL